MAANAFWDARARRAAPHLSELREESPTSVETQESQRLAASGVDLSAAAEEGEGEDPYETALPQRTSLGHGGLVGLVR